MKNITSIVLREIGLYRWPPFARDNLFWLAVVTGPFVWIILWLTVVPTFVVDEEAIGKLVLAGVIYYPVLEEILFRGIIQGWLLSQPWGRNSFLQITTANAFTSILFVIAHLWYQPVSWAIMVFVPSLIYGFFRDRFQNSYPSILLHIYYNAGFMLINIYAQ